MIKNERVKVKLVFKSEHVFEGYLEDRGLCNRNWHIKRVVHHIILH